MPLRQENARNKHLKPVPIQSEPRGFDVGDDAAAGTDRSKNTKK
jgi:hypothetical protein